MNYALANELFTYDAKAIEQYKKYGFSEENPITVAWIMDQCHLDKVFYDENSISYAVMH